MKTYTALKICLKILTYTDRCSNSIRVLRSVQQIHGSYHGNACNVVTLSASYCLYEDDDDDNDNTYLLNYSMEQSPS